MADQIYNQTPAEQKRIEEAQRALYPVEKMWIGKKNHSDGNTSALQFLSVNTINNRSEVLDEKVSTSSETVLEDAATGKPLDGEHLVQPVYISQSEPDLKIQRMTTTSSQTSPDAKQQITAEDLTTSNPSEVYLEVLAEQCRLALEETLEENKTLYERIAALEAELASNKVLLDEARALVKMFIKMVGDKEENEANEAAEAHVSIAEEAREDVVENAAESSKDLEKALEENKRLYARIEALEAELASNKVLLDEARAMVEVFSEIVDDKEENEANEAAEAHVSIAEEAHEDVVENAAVQAEMAALLAAVEDETSPKKQKTQESTDSE